MRGNLRTDSIFPLLIKVLPKGTENFGNLEEVILQGLIVGNISNLYKIEYEEKIYEAVAKGKFKLENITPVVGDIVEFEITDEENRKAFITKISDRKTYIKRPKLANISRFNICYF